MRVLIDTNILISALLWPHSRPAEALFHVAENHEPVLCDRNVSEFREVLERKAPQALADMEVFLAELPYDLIPAVEHADKLIRDSKDQPILNAAIIGNVDIIITGDKDFLVLDLDHPKCVTAAEYLEKYI